MKETYCLFRIFQLCLAKNSFLEVFLFSSIFYGRSYAFNKSNLIFMTWNFATSKKDSLSGTSRFQIIMVWSFLILIQIFLSPILEYRPCKLSLFFTSSQEKGKILSKTAKFVLWKCKDLAQKSRQKLKINGPEWFETHSI